MNTTTHQFDWKRLLAFNEEDYRRECLIQLRWKGKITCPKCTNSEKKIYECKDRRFRCSVCDNRFSATSGTVLHSTKLPLLTWFHALYQFSVIKTGISSYTMAEILNTTQMTGWRVNNRLRMGMSNSNHFKGKLSGIVEVDETYVGGKNWNRHADKKIPNSRGRSAKDKTPIVGMVTREGKLKLWRMRRNDGINPTLPGKGIRALLKSQVEPGTTFATDEFRYPSKSRSKKLRKRRSFYEPVGGLLVKVKEKPNECVLRKG
jgi:transposase-like protein